MQTKFLQRPSATWAAIMTPLKWLGAGALALALVACGGGSAGSQQDPMASGLDQLRRAVATSSQVPKRNLMATARSQPLAAIPPTITADQFFDWAERTYPAFYPGHQADQSMPPFVLRYYPATANFLAVNGDVIYALGPVSANQVINLGKLADFACRVSPAACTVTDPPVAHSFVELFAWQGNHASTINRTNSSGSVDHVGTTVWWNEDAWDIVGDSSYLATAYDDFGAEIGKQTGFHIDVHKAVSADPTNSAEDNTLMLVGGNGAPGVAAMRLDQQGVLGARLRNPMLISATQAGVVEFYAPRFVTTGHWWEVAITPANQVIGATNTAVPAQIGRAPFEDGLNVVVIGHDDVPCTTGWHVRYDVSRTVGGVETLLEEQHSSVDQFTSTHPSEKDALYHWRIEFRPNGLDLYADFQKTGQMTLQRHVDMAIPWAEVNVHLLGVAYQADHHPQGSACYQGKVRELNWRNVSVSPVKYARTSIAPRNGVSTNVQRNTGWMGYDLRDIQRFGPAVGGAPQANLDAYNAYAAMAFGSVDLRWAGAPAPVSKRSLSVDLSAEQATAALARLVYDIKGRGSVRLTVNGTTVGAIPDMNSVRYFAAQAQAGDNNLGEFTHRGVAIPAGLLKTGSNVVHLELTGEVVLDRLHLEFGHLQ